MKTLKKEKITPAEVQRMFGISAKTERYWRKKGTLPKPTKIGGRVYYSKRDLKRHINRQIE